MWEHIRKIHLTLEKFSMEKGTLTFAQKLRRHMVDKTYAKELLEMYQSPP